MARTTQNVLPIHGQSNSTMVRTITTILILLLLAISTGAQQQTPQNIPDNMQGGQTDGRTAKWDQNWNSNRIIQIQTDKEHYKCLNYCDIKVNLTDTKSIHDGTQYAKMHYTDDRGHKQLQYVTAENNQLTFRIPYDITDQKTHKFNMTYEVDGYTYKLDPAISAGCTYQHANNKYYCTGALTGDSLHTNNASIHFNSATMSLSSNGWANLTTTWANGWIIINSSTITGASNDAYIHINATDQIDITASTLTLQAGTQNPQGYSAGMTIQSNTGDIIIDTTAITVEGGDPVGGQDNAHAGSGSLYIRAPNGDIYINTTTAKTWSIDGAIGGDNY